MIKRIKPILPGFLLAFILGNIALFLSSTFTLPATLLALFGGLALSFTYRQHAALIQNGVNLSSGFILRLGIALLGLHLVFADVVSLGWGVLAMVVVAICAMLLISFIGARLLSLRAEFGVLSGGAVSICGASAAMALHSVLPKHKNSERDLSLVIVAITACSTLEMILTPLIGHAIGLNTKQMGLFLGGVIHDVAQTAGAGFAVSEGVGEIAVLTKMIRVSFLLPVVVAVALAFKTQTGGAGARFPLPLFLIMFFVLMTGNSLLPIPAAFTDIAALISKTALITAMAAIGLKTNISDLFSLGAKPVLLIGVQALIMSVIIMSFVLLL
jgi:uncharacterized integral membrane protein (TIGR00698 family)